MPEFNPLSPNIHIQILQTDLQTFPWRISWENVIKGDYYVNSHNLISWECIDIVRRRLMLVTLGTFKKGKQEVWVNEIKWEYSNKLNSLCFMWTSGCLHTNEWTLKNLPFCWQMHQKLLSHAAFSTILQWELVHTNAFSFETNTFVHFGPAFKLKPSKALTS